MQMPVGIDEKVEKAALSVVNVEAEGESVLLVPVLDPELWGAAAAL